MLSLHVKFLKLLSTPALLRRRPLMISALFACLSFTISDSCMARVVDPLQSHQSGHSIPDSTVFSQLIESARMTA